MSAAAERVVRPRGVARLIRGRPTVDGAGVRLTRVIGGSELPQLDPFLLFDVFESADPDDYIAGFPPHPHRGFETVTYMLAGRMEHRDSAGNRGLIEAGGVQWMTAAGGIIHSEMPQQEHGLLRGVQVWVNLPGRLKLGPPGYREFAAADIPGESHAGGTQLRVVAGRAASGTTGPVRGVVTSPLFLDLALPAGASLQQPVPAGQSGLLFVTDGEVAVHGPGEAVRVPAGALAVLTDGDQLQVRGEAVESRALLLAATPLGEPVVRSGPFVMNTPEELVQAFRDYQAGRLAPAFQLMED